MGAGNAEKQFAVEWKNIEKAHLVFYYHTQYNCFIVWNASILKATRKATSRTVALCYGENIRKTLQLQKVSDIECLDKENKRGSGIYEKVVIFPEKKLLDFCENFEDYIYPSVEEMETGNYLCVLPDGKVLENGVESCSQILREKERISRLRRDPDFRKRVLEKYYTTCLICGCNEESILEAAHIKGVAEGGDDSTENGFCLCRNHHRLYDAGMLTVDFDNNKFSCSSEAEKSMAWYKVAEKENFKLHIK